MSARNARNIALVGLVVVAWVFAVETAAMGAVLQKQGESEASVRLMMILSVASLLVSVLACARAVAVVRFRAPVPPTTPTVPAQRSLERREEAVAV